MQVKNLKSLFDNHKETRLFHRYICNDHVLTLIKELSNKFEVSTIGHSVKGEEIHAIKFGTGSKRILLWSQMHGNESTTTKALFDLLNTLSANDDLFNSLGASCTITIIPILNPDGARAYTRVNANEVDLNRDAQDLTQPESRILKSVYDDFMPHYCFNLHGQRTIFGVGATNKSATVSFLAPSEDEERSITDTRKKAMEIISFLNTNLQNQIPGQVGIYDDSFNINCVGDNFQSLGSVTVLFEAGHFKDDYSRETTRFFIYQSLLLAIDYISNNTISGEGFEPYLNIPNNEKSFFDIIIRNASVFKDEKFEIVDIGIQYKEILSEGNVLFVPKIEKIERLNGFYGHRELDAKEHKVLTNDFQPIYLNYENDFVFINNEKYSLKLINT